MSELPKGWSETTIREVAEYVSRGRSPKYIHSSNLPVINQRCIRWDGIDEEHLKFVDPDTWHQWGEERFVRKGDILWNSTGRGTIGRAALYCGLPSHDKAVVDSHVTIVRPAKGIEPSYLFSYIKSPSIQDNIENMQSGSTNQVELNKQTIEETTIPLAPLAEQKRIVAKIDGLTNRTARARIGLESIPALVEKYKDAVINAAFASLNLSVPLLALVDQDRGIPYGIVQTGKHQIDGIPTVRAGDIKGFCLLEDGLKRVSPDIAAQYGRTVLHGGEVLIAIRGSVGETCVVPASMRGSNISREVALIPVADGTNPSFIMYFLKSSRAAAYIKSNTKGIAQTGINLRDLKKLPSPNIPVAEQLKLVERIETAFSWLDRVSADYTAVTKLLPKLDAAILSKAFRGGLVTQDQNDEPASTLLTRIHVERAAAPKKPRQRRTKDKKMTRDPKERLLKDSETWPENGLPFEQVSKRNSIPYDDMRDVIFALLSGPKPILRQVFDKNAECMHLQRIEA